MLRVETAAEMDDLLSAALDGQLTLAPRAGDEAKLPPAASDDPVLQRAAVVIATSGSTGRPKGVVLSAPAMLASADATIARLGRLAWVSPLPFQYVAGLMTLVRSLRADLPHVRCRADLSDLVVPDAPAAISLVPTQLHRALANPDRVAQLRRFEAVLLGGAAADPGLLDAARSAGLAVVTSYGMSETCGGCVYDGVPLDGVEVVLDDDARIWLGGPVLFEGYLGDPELTAQTLQHGRLRTHDRGRWGDGRLHVEGRFDDVVISGGVNVDLAAMQRLVDQIAPDSAVCGAPHRDWGTAVVLLTASPMTDLDEWKTRLSAAGAPRAGLPKAVVVLDRLPRVSSGKIDRQALSRLVADQFN